MHGDGVGDSGLALRLNRFLARFLGKARVRAGEGQQQGCGQKAKRAESGRRMVGI